jgi:hypothetical protein
MESIIDDVNEALDHGSGASLGPGPVSVSASVRAVYELEE